jgi:two-component system, chemotaxis family, chemotaxis protein CheY
MTNARQTILVVDSNPETRARLVRDLAPTGCRVLEAADGERGLQLVRASRVRLVVSELFLKTADSDCLFQAIRQNRVHGTRMLAHTVHRTSSDRDWAKLWGASGFLVQPTRTERLKHVVQRILTPARSNAKFVRTSRRKTLSGAFAEIESGAVRGTSSIVVGRSWWTGLSASERNGYRRRAKRSAITLRADSMMSSTFVELRNAPRPADIEAS